MRKLAILFLIPLFLLSCKKKEEKKAEDEPPAVPKQFSAKINGSLFECDFCTNSYYSGGMHGINISEGGTNRMVFNFDKFPKPGSFTLQMGTPASFTYEKDGRYFRGRGTLSVSAADTSAKGSLKKFIATFSCTTDTSSTGVSYNFTEGNINFNMQ